MILAKPITLLISVITFFQFFGCTQDNTYKEKVSSKVEYLQSDAHKKNDAPYSQAVRVDDILYLSGVIGRKPGESDLVPGGIKPETRQAMENVKTLLENYGSSLDDVVKCMCMLGDISDYADRNKEYKKFFPENRPARSTFGVDLPLGAKIEIECMAKLG
ncbi:MAG: RidA family protein [Candidatus Neomarinimicrobiota bacterium]|nr:RidA family protein [Candidatus Neomarinimicrobiota bacterium]